MTHISMRTDKTPFSDVRVRQAISLAIDRQGIIDADARGRRASSTRPVPAALKEWALPIDQLGEGAQYYQHDPAEAKRLLAAAGYPERLPGHASASRPTAPRSSSTPMQLVLKYLKDVGIDAKLDQKEYGAYIATCFYGKFDSMAFGPQTPVPRARQLPLRPVLPGGARRTRATSTTRWWPTCSSASGAPSTPPSAREVIHEIQRHLAKQQYYVQLPSGVYIARLGRRAQELRAEPRLRLRRAAASPPGSIGRGPDATRAPGSLPRQAIPTGSRPAGFGAVLRHVPAGGSITLP